jgi:hypothetical protein
MIVAAVFLVAGMGSLALIARALRKAPESYEDEHGFHIVRDKAVKPGVPGIEDNEDPSVLRLATRPSAIPAQPRLQEQHDRQTERIIVCAQVGDGGIHKEQHKADCGGRSDQWHVDTDTPGSFLKVFTRARGRRVRKDYFFKLGSEAYPRRLES